MSSDPPGVLFYVDGHLFRSTAAFSWLPGSEHTLWADYLMTGLDAGTRYTFVGWSDSSGLVTSTTTAVTLMADPRITSIVVTFKKEYLVQLNFFRCDAVTGCQDSPGTVYIGQVPYTSDASLYYVPNSTFTASAVPNPGFVFSGWNTNLAVAGQTYINVVVAGPMSLSPSFAPAKQVTLASSPPELQILVDRSPLTTPTMQEWAVNSTHVLSAPASQFDRTGNLWVLSAWDFGGGYDATYKVGPNVFPSVTLTATFVPGVRASFLTNPSGLKLTIDGRDNWPSYNFVWAVGGTYAISAPTNQLDAKGRRWVFTGWSNGGPATQNVVMSADAATQGFRLTATYSELGQVNINSVPPGVLLSVAGSACPTPCTLDRAPGTTIKITAPASIGVSDFSRLDFAGWADGGPLQRSYTFSSNADSLLASYGPSYRLVLTANPPDGADVAANPASADGFYAAGTSVQVTATARPGYKFRRWSGDLDTNFPSTYITMSGPRFLTALADKIPYIPPAGIRNGAGVTPDAVVAPGSVIAITGLNLAPREETGPVSPVLAQTLAGTAVSLGDRILPLLAASPTQITAVLPSDLSEGDYVLTVRPEQMAEVSGSFTVVRNAPGLFGASADDKPFASALHADGKPVTPDSPARSGETVTLLATGLGPYNPVPPDGFPVPSSPAYKLVDSLDILSGDLVLQPVSVAAQPATVGTAGIKMTVGADLPSGAAEIRVRVNGRVSNTVVLPLQ